jgi:hypothetical protein
MRTVEEILEHLSANRSAYALDWDIWKDIEMYLANRKPKRPDVTTIRGEGVEIVIETPTDETRITPERSSCYLVFDQWRYVLARYDPGGRWAFKIVSTHIDVEDKGTKITIRPATEFQQYQFCGKDLGLACLLKPCPVCEGPAVGRRSGLDDGNHRDNSDHQTELDERKTPHPLQGGLNAVQREFLAEAGWKVDGVADFEESLCVELLERHEDDVRAAEKHKESIVPPLTATMNLLLADSSIPLGWAIEAGRPDVLKARSALALARIARTLHSNDIIGEDSMVRLCEPWTKMSPGRSWYANH